MDCTKRVTKFDKSVGRELTTCEKFDGAADSELGTFAFAPSGLHWGWGVGAGLAVSVIGGQLGGSGLLGKTMSADGVNYNLATPEAKAKWALILGLGLPVATGAVMAIFRRTRTAGWGMIGAGIVGGGVQYAMVKSGKDTLFTRFAGGLNGDLAGMIAARQMMGAGNVQILGLPVAKEIKGAGPVQIMGAGAKKAPVEVMSGSFGASFGTNFSTQ